MTIYACHSVDSYPGIGLLAGGAIQQHTLHNRAHRTLGHADKQSKEAGIWHYYRSSIITHQAHTRYI